MMKKINSFLLMEKELFHLDKTKYIFEAIIYISILILSFMLPSFSYTSLHNLPLLFVGLVCILIIAYLFKYKTFSMNKCISSMILFLLVIIISSMLNDISQIKKTEFLLIIMCIILYEFISSNNHLIRSIYALYFGLTLFFIYFFIIYHKEILSLDFKRLGSAFGNVNAIGEYFMVGYLFGLYLVIIRKNFLLVIPTGIFIIFGFLTGSKSFFLSLLLLSVCFIVMIFGRKKWYISLISIVSVIIVILVLLNLPMFATMKKRIISMLNTLLGNNSSYVDMSTVERYNMIFEAFYLFTFKPVFGWGTNGFAINGSYATYSHTTITELLCDFGLAGFVLFIIPIICSFNRPKSSAGEKQWILKYLLLIYICWLLFFGVLLGDKLYYLIMAYILSMNNNKTDNHKKILEEDLKNESQSF